MSSAAWFAPGIAFAVAIGVAIPTAAQPTRAGDGDGELEARGLFQAGSAAFEQGRYEDALDYFRQSYAHSGRPELLYNIGQCADRLRLDADAIQAFEQYLAAVPNSPFRTEVENRVRALRAHASNSASTATARPPSHAARRAGPAIQTGPPPAEATPRSRSVLSQWWFWTALAVVVAGGVVATVLIVGAGPDDAALRTGNFGAVVFTLEAP